MTTYGGVEITCAKVDGGQSAVVARSPYYYEIYAVQESGSFALPALGSMTVFISSLPKDGTVQVTGVSERGRAGDLFQIEGKCEVRQASAPRGTTLLIAGVTSLSQSATIKLVPQSLIKKVTKPWGHELWLSGEHESYALKEIFIRAPHKTSLQYHNLKSETTVIFGGQAKLHFKSNPDVSNDLVTPADVGTVPIEKGAVLSVRPPVLHRLEALADITLYEASTPHLDDVIRVSDDAQRPHGRIDSEHRAT